MPIGRIFIPVFPPDEKQHIPHNAQTAQQHRACCKQWIQQATHCDRNADQVINERPP